MHRRLLLTLVTAAGLFGLFAVYSVAMRTIVEVPNETKPNIELLNTNSYEPPDENRRVAIKYLPEWAAKSDLGLHADHAFIFTNQWKRIENNKKRVQFTPFAMAWLLHSGTGGQENAMTISSESAVLEFESEFDEKFGNPGRVVKAIFNDSTRITGPNGLQLIGQNFIFDESALNLSTSYPVEFRYLSHQGSATQMKMKLIPSPGVPGSDRPHIFGVETVTLKGGINRQQPDRSGVVLHSKMPQGQETMLVRLKCHGDLNFNVLTNTAVFEDDIRATMKTKENDNVPTTAETSEKYTSLTCNKLTIHLMPKAVVEPAIAANSPPPTAAPADHQTFNQNLEFDWMIAEGTNKDDRVFVKSTKYEMAADMTRLAYWSVDRHVSMASENPERPLVVVKQLRRNGSTMQAPIIDATYNLDNTLKTLECEGAGELRFVDDKTDKVSLVATWLRKFMMKKDDASNLHLVELYEKAQFRQPGQATRLGADLIKIWLAKINMQIDPAASNPANADSASSQVPEPKRLSAEGNVVLISPRMIVDWAKKFDLQFDESDDPQANNSNPKLRSQLQLVSLTQVGEPPAKWPMIPHTNSTAKPVRSSRRHQLGFANVPAEADANLGSGVAKPFDPTSANRQRSPATQKPPSPPIRVRADQIRAQMSRAPDGEKLEPRDVHAQGNVTMTQQGEFGEKAFSLNGDSVDMHSESENQSLVHVLGRPAVIRNEKFNLEGKDINLDRGKNRAWVRGPGEMKLPIPRRREHA